MYIKVLCQKDLIENQRECVKASHFIFDKFKLNLEYINQSQVCEINIKNTVRATRE